MLEKRILARKNHLRSHFGLAGFIERESVFTSIMKIINMTFIKRIKGGGYVARSRINLLPDEKILLRGSCVKHGFWGAYTDELVLTNLALIHINLGLFGNYKNTTRYSFDSVNQIVVGEASNGEKQLEVYHSGGEDDFAFQSGNKKVLKVWELAINDQMSGHSGGFDAAYYGDLLELAENEKDNGRSEDTDEGGIDVSFIGNVAKNVLSSGDLSVNGVMRGVKKTAKNQAFAKAATGVINSLGLEGVSASEGSNKHEALGFKQRMKQARMERMMLDEIQEEPNESNASNTGMVQGTLSMQEQLQLLKQLKELLDMGALTQEEFDKKKQQIMEM